MISDPVEWANDAGQWNQFEILADHDHLQLFQNGIKIKKLMSITSNARVYKENSSKQTAEGGRYSCGGLRVVSNDQAFPTPR